MLCCMTLEMLLLFTGGRLWVVYHEWAISVGSDGVACVVQSYETAPIFIS